MIVSFSGFMSWILVIPFDVLKTVIQAETNLNKHCDLFEMFKAKIRVSCWSLRNM